MEPVTVISFGAGQQSIYILRRLIADKEFYNRTVIGRLVVAGSDTGNEHPHTYKAVEYAKQLCHDNGIEFHWITPDMGYHANTWQSLTGHYERNSNIGSAAYRQSCTDKLKVKVIDNFIEAWLKQNYGCQGQKKKAYYEYLYSTYQKENSKWTPIRLILGFAKGEEHRTKNGNKFDPIWKQKTMARYYPLIEEGISRQDCIDYNVNTPLQIFPSNCMFCFYQSDQEIIWLHRNYPAAFAQWVHLEQNKLAKYAGIEKNFGVYGKITLTQKLEKALALYGHWSDDQLNDYKFSHGHCIKSAY